MLNDKILLDYSNLFSPNEYKKNDKIILKYFQEDLNELKLYRNVCNQYRKLKNKKQTKKYIFEKH